MDDVASERPDDVRKLQTIFGRLRPGAGTCFAEYVGGRVKIFEVDRFLFEEMLDHLEHRGA